MPVFLGVVVLGVIATTAYWATLPKSGEEFTEFYLLGPDGTADSLPEEVVVGQEASVIVGIANHEDQATTYRVEVVIDGVIVAGLGRVTLEHNGKYETWVGFTPEHTGEDKKVEFLLYTNEETEPWQELYLLVDIVQN